MKIRRQLIDIIPENVPERYDTQVRFERGQEIIYLWMLKALYRMIISMILYYKKFRKDIE